MWGAFIALLFGSMALIIVGWQGWQEKLPRQHWAGIRTPYTMQSDEHWKAVHRFGAPYMIFGGVAAFSAALAMLPFAMAGVLPGGFAAAVAIGIAVVILAAALLSWWKGVSAAKAHFAR